MDTILINSANCKTSDPHRMFLNHRLLLNYQHDLRVLQAFVSNKLFGQLLDILPKHFRFLKTFNSEFSYIEVQLTDQNSKPQEIDDKINITLVIHKSVTYEK